MSRDVENGEIKNRILRSLPRESLDRLRPHLEPIALPLREVLLHTSAPIRHIDFIEDGFVSLVKSMTDGRTVEIGGVGNEGLVGISALHGIGKSIFECIVQLPGKALRIDSATLLGKMARDHALRELTLRYAYAAVDQIAQTAACNRLHSLEQRCARWLLIAHDAANADKFPLTHEFLAVMLGVQRPQVTVVLNAMHKSGLIDAARGSVTVRDRDGLERASCECYTTIRREIDQIFAA